MIRALIADDDKNLRKVLVNELSEEGIDVDEAENGVKAAELAGKGEYDVILLDLNMPGVNGMDVLKSVKCSDAPAEVIILTGHATVSTAVEAMKLGAYDYLTKPFKMEELNAIIQKAYEKKRLLHENLLLKAQIRRQSDQIQIVAKSTLLLNILENVKKVAESDFSVLVSGETGVGKELIAKAIHAESRRAAGPFIAINCGAIPENMLESELFGYEKGAFTGAVARKPGLLETADHGTLFLDEISEMSLQLQGKLHRAIETGRFFRVGGTKEVQTDVRFISATNRNLREDEEKGRFRSDLYFRICTLNIHIPPLRERKEDIPPLIDHFIWSYPAFRKKRFTEEAIQVLCRYKWPGNVRELQNVVYRTLLLSKSGVIRPEELHADLPNGTKEPTEIKGRVKTLEDIEREHILRVLKETGGRRGLAAEMLGVDPKTLYRKLLSYGVIE